MTTQTYTVAGMTCDHCVRAVTEELRSLDGVMQVSVDLHPGGASHVTVDAEREVADAEVAEALDEAGAYALV
jgi:copper chaperone CopZ